MEVRAFFGSYQNSYTSLQQRTILDFRNEELASTTLVQPMLLPKLQRQSIDALSKTHTSELFSVFQKAASLFRSGSPDGTDFRTYCENVSRSTGLPIQVVYKKSVLFYEKLLSDIADLVEIQLGVEAETLDRGFFHRKDIALGLSRRGNQVGFVMPGNHPSTHNLWLIALAMKFPILVRPSFEDVFTPYRLVCALYEAGLPQNALFFLPGEHDMANALVEKSDLSVVFGGRAIYDKYHGRPHVKVYGPGRSKAIVLKDADFDQSVETITRLVLDDGGRGCINCSAVLVEGNAEPLARAVAERLRDVPMLSPLDEEATLPAVLSKQKAESYLDFIEERLDGAIDLSLGSKLNEVDKATILGPRVILTSSINHPLFGVELPFPFVVFSSIHSTVELKIGAKSSLAVVLVGDDDDIFHNLLLEPSIHKVYRSGQLSTEYDPREPHEGYISNFLFEYKAVRL